VSVDTFTQNQTVLVALLPKRNGGVSTTALAAAAGISLPTVHAELRPLIEAGVVTYHDTLDEYRAAGAKS